MRTLFAALSLAALMAVLIQSQVFHNALADDAKVRPEKAPTPPAAFEALGLNRCGYLEFRRTIDGATMIYVPAGDFPKRDYVGDPLAPQSQAMLHVDGFLIDKYEITNAQVAAFLGAQKGLKFSDGQVTAESGEVLALSHEWGLAIGKTGATVRAGYENFPAVGGSGYLALAYAKWAGAELPCAYEWEKAAAGPSALEFPWGGQMPDSTRANYFLAGPHHTVAVGSYPDGASPYGVLDMAGNVYERTFAAEKPADRAPNAKPVYLKGGAWVSAHWANLRCSDHCAQPMAAAEGSVGFRTIIRDPAVLQALSLTGNAKLLVFDNTEKAFAEASKRNVPIFLFLGFETCGQTDRVRAQILTDPRFVAYCNEKLVVLAGHNPGEGAQAPVPAGADGGSLLIPGCKLENLEQVFDDFVRMVDVTLVPMQIREFKVSPGMFVLNPHKVLLDEPDQLVLVGEDKLPKSGAFLDEFLKQFEAAQKLLGEGQSRADYLAGKPSPKTIWQPPAPKDD